MATALDEEVDAPFDEELTDQAAEETQEPEQEPTKEPAASVPPEPPADCPAHMREHYEAIREKEREVRGLEGEYLEAKEAAGEAKKAFEAADKALRNLISRGADPQLPLPFDRPATVRVRLTKDIEVQTATAPCQLKAGVEFDAFHDGADGGLLIDVDGQPFHKLQEGTFERLTADAENDAWRKAPLSELGLTDKQLELFASASVETIGQLEDLRAKIADGKAEWPKGIGPGKVTDIENKVIDWLTANRDKFGQPAQAADIAAEPPAQAPDTSDQVPAEVEAHAHAKTNGKPKRPKLRGGLAGKPAPNRAKKGKTKRK